MHIKEAINTVIEGRDLSESEAEAVMGQIMSGEATPAQIGGFLCALRSKGETFAEITGFARSMRGNAINVRPRNRRLVDIVGTGGDKGGTFNISTTAAFVAAASGAAVAKHGNRSVSSSCGGADVLEALGVNIELSPERVGDCIDEVGIGFLFAPRLHPAMKHAIGPRREMGVRTVFNILGPLTNPAEVEYQLLGVYDPLLTEAMALALKGLGCRRAYVVCGAGDIDELSTAGLNQVTELCDGEINTFTLDPESLRLPRASLDAFRGGDAPVNAGLVREVLGGEQGPRRDVVLLNAAAALLVTEVVSDLPQGLKLAAEAIDSGAARAKLDSMIDFSNDNYSPMSPEAEGE